MKHTKSKLKMLAFAGIALATMTITSCKKSSGTSVTPLGGYNSSDDVAATSLVAYFPFDGNSNDTKGVQTATAVGVTYNTGMRGMAYQGAVGAYATVTASAAFSNLPSYTLSVWYKLGAQPANGDAAAFFLTGTNTLNEMIYEIEPNHPVSGDSVKIHTGFTNLASPGWQNFTMEAYDTAAIGKWVHVVTTYDGPSSTYVVYQNGTPILNKSAFGTQTSNILYQDGAKAALLGSLSWSKDPPKTIILGTWPATLYGVSPTLGANGAFLGQMDELRVYNKALSVSEVAGLFLNGQAGR